MRNPKAEELARHAWKQTPREGSIAVTAGLLSEAEGGDAATLYRDILHGLQSLSSAFYKSAVETNIVVFGSANIDDETCYWWVTPEQAFWSDLKPSWWDEKVAELRGEAAEHPAQPRMP